MFSLFTKKSEPPTDSLALQSDLQRAKLDLAERDKALARLQADVERLRADSQTLAKTAIERLGKDAAGPMAQLLALAHLLEQEGKPVQAADLLSVARKLLRSLADHGITVASEAGIRAAFDPNQHEPLSVETPIVRGKEVIVKFPCIACNGVVVRKAGVTLA